MDNAGRRGTTTTPPSGAGLEPLVIVGSGGFGREVLQLVTDINAHKPTFDLPRLPRRQSRRRARHRAPGRADAGQFLRARGSPGGHRHRHRCADPSPSYRRTREGVRAADSTPCASLGVGRYIRGHRGGRRHRGGQSPHHERHGWAPRARERELHHRPRRGPGVVRDGLPRSARERWLPRGGGCHPGDRMRPAARRPRWSRRRGGSRSRRRPGRRPRDHRCGSGRAPHAARRGQRGRGNPPGMSKADQALASVRSEKTSEAEAQPGRFIQEE